MNNVTIIVTIIACVQAMLLAFVKWRRDKDMAGVDANAKQLAAVLANVAWLTKTCERQDAELSIVRVAHEKCQADHVSTIKEFAGMMNEAMIKVSASVTAQALIEQARITAAALRGEAAKAAIIIDGNK